MRWQIANGFATSPDLPGVRIPGEPFMGTMGVAPSRELFEQITRRERALHEQGEDVALPDSRGAVPALEPIASEGLRTKPRERTGGTWTCGRWSPALGSCSPCGRRVPSSPQGTGTSRRETGSPAGRPSRCGPRFACGWILRKSEAAERGLRDVRFESPVANSDVRRGRTFSTTGLCVYADGGGRANDLTVAARNALRNMIDHLVEEFDYSRQQAYAISSVAVDLKVGEVVDSPNYVATATLPIEIFE